MLLLFSILVFVVGKVGLDLVVGNVFKACVLQLRLVGERVAAALIVCIHAGEVELADQVLQLFVLIVCLAGLIQNEVAAIGLQRNGCALEKINAIYEEKKDFWIESIFKKVTGR